MSYRPLGQFPQYFLDNGQVNAGGYIRTYETDLTTPKLTYSDPALTIPNTNPLTLDASGRPTTDVWGDGAFGMEIADAANVVYLTANNIQPDTGSTQTIPALETGEFLTNDGSNLLWDAILQVPDPSGFADYILSNDGANALWIPQPEAPEPDIEVTSTTFRAGTADNTSKYFTQVGTGTAEASGTNTTQVSVTFPEPFTSIPIVIPMPNVASVATGGFLVAVSVIAKSSTSFTVKFDTNDQGSSASNIINDVTFDWVAFGRKTVT